MRAQIRLIAFSILGLCLIGALAVASSPVTTDTSSRGAARAGTAALYDWLARLGYQTEQISGAFDPTGAGLLVVDNPSALYSATDAARLHGFVDGGGAAIVASSDPAAIKTILEAFNVGLEGRSTALTAAADSGLGSGPWPVQTVALTGNALVLNLPPDGAPLLTTAEGVVGGDLPVGTGHLYLVGDGAAFDNDGLRKLDDAGFALTLVHRAPAGPVAFDDVHHQLQNRDPMAVIFQSPLGVGVLIAAFALMIGLYTNGRHLGRPVPAGDPGRVPSADTYVMAIAQLFERSDDTRSVALRYGETFRARLGTAYGVDWRRDDEAFVSAIAGFDPERRDQLASLLARSRQLSAGPPEVAALVALARDIDAYERGALTSAPPV